MKRLFFLLAIAACDPDLSVPAPPASPDGGPGPAPTGTVQPIPDSGPPSEAGADGGGDAGASHKIDGTNDFTSGETFMTTTTGYSGYVTWDDKNVYFGMSGPDVGSGATNKWVLIYVSGTPSSSTGIDYACGNTCTSQKASLPFAAGYHVRWKTDGSYTNLQKSDGFAWTDRGAISDVAVNGSFMEIAVSRAAIGSPTQLDVEMFMLTEANNGTTYAGVPQGTFSDGTNPSMTKYLHFDLSDRSTAPNAFPVKP